jgi:tryptophan-rich sensory protein
MVWYKHPIFVCVCACILPNIGGFLGSLFTDTSKGSWYDQLEKPVFNPPTWVRPNFQGFPSFS